MTGAPNEAAVAFRQLPSVESLLLSEEVIGMGGGLTREVLAELVRATVDAWRGRIAREGLEAPAVRERIGRGELLADLERAVRVERGRGLRPAINATGVVLHTGLGRAPVHPEAAAAMAEAAGAYCVLEVDRFSGERNQRDDRLGVLLRRATGAQEGIAVNNCAAAVMLALNTFGAGREVIVSRGELVEIGGSFRMPDVMERAGVSLREVGTTNRTRLEDFRRAIGDRTGLLLKVHRSNFRQQGFIAEVGAAELAELGREAGLPTAFDLGSGRLELEGSRPLEPLADEARVSEAVAGGVDVVTFSGDKLLGGPQAGLVVGRRGAVAAMRDNPMYRALRLDKATLAGLERTLELLLDGRGDELPARGMILATPEELELRAQSLARGIAELPGYEVEVIENASQPGSGSAPHVFLPTRVAAVRPLERSVGSLAAALRAGDPPVFARIQEGRLLLDPRTLLEGDDERLVEAFRAVGGPGRPS